MFCTTAVGTKEIGSALADAAQACRSSLVASVLMNKTSLFA